MKCKLRVLGVLLVAICAFSLFFGTGQMSASAEVFVTGGVDVATITWEKTIRNEEKPITDAGILKNPCDLINLNAIFGYDINALRKTGYKTLMIRFELDIREVNDGYQRLYIFSGADADAVQLTQGIENFTHGDIDGRDICDVRYERYAFYAEIELKQIPNDSICIRYDAAGKNEDTWRNKFLEAQVGLSLKDRNIAYLAYLGTASY